MKNWGASGFKNYGMIPVNEYTTTNTEKRENSDAVSGQAPRLEGMELEWYLPKRRAQYRIIRLRSHGWLRSRSTNGWRAESASQQDEAAGEEHIDNVRKD